MVRGQNGQVNEIRGLALWQRIIGETSRSHSQPKRNPQLEQTRVAAMRGEAYALAGDKTRARHILREMQVHAKREHVPSRSWRQQSKSVPPMSSRSRSVPFLTRCARTHDSMISFVELACRQTERTLEFPSQDRSFKTNHCKIPVKGV